MSDKGKFSPNDKNSSAEEKYRALFTSMDEGYFLAEVIFDKDNNPIDILYLEANPSATKMVGEDFTGKRLSEINPGYEPYWFDIFGSVARSGTGERLEQYAEPDKKWYSFYVFKVGEKQSHQVAVIFQDITKRKQREEHAAFVSEIIEEFTHLSKPGEIIQAIGAKIGAYLDLTVCNFVEIDEAQEIATINYAWTKEGIPKALGKFLIKDYLTEAYEKACRAGEIFVINDTEKDPRADAKAHAGFKIGAFVGVPFHNKGQWKYCFIIADSKPRNWQEDEIKLLNKLTNIIFPRLDRARSEAGLRDSQEKYRIELEKQVEERTRQMEGQNQRLLEAQRLGRIGDFYFDTVTGHVTWSDELYRMMDVPINEPMNFETALSFYVESDRQKLAQLAEESLKSGSGFEMEAAFIPRGQSLHRYLFVRANVVGNTGINGVVQDITERKEIELKLQESAKFIQSKNKELELVNNDLKTFTTIAAYDYESTLRTLYTNLEFIISREAKNLTDTGKANLRKAQRAIQKMKLMVDDIVALSKIETPDSTPSEVDLNLVIGLVTAQLHDKIIEAEAEIKVEQLPTVNGFPLLLTLLFQHLLDNAIKFRKPDTKPEITVAYHLSKGKNHGQAHQICVIDNGIGFPQEEAEKILRMFYRLHDKEYKGSGIGLAICKKIVGLHGATIKIESEPGAGTTVRCFFPVN